MGGTELASFSILVIQQPLEGSKALPLAQGVENPREEPRVEQRCLVGMDTASQQHGVAKQARQDTPHQPQSNLHFRPNPGFSGDLDAHNEGFQRAGSLPVWLHDPHLEGSPSPTTSQGTHPTVSVLHFQLVSP